MSLKAILLFAATATCQRFLFSFGDSYSTTSFNIAGDKPSAANPIGNPPYPGITTCNGPNYVDVFTTSTAGTLAYNFAVSGAAVNNSITPRQGSNIPDFVVQRELFSGSVVPAPSFAPWNSANSIFTAFFGINDISLSYLQGNTPLTPNPQIFQTYTNELSALYNAGARRFILLSVPPFNQAPVYLSLPNSLIAPLVANDIAAWNSQLSTTATSFMAANPGSIVKVLDTAPIFQTILANPTAYGAPDNTCTNTDGVSCLWWDSLHPGQAIQKALGEALVSVAQSVGFFS